MLSWRDLASVVVPILVCIMGWFHRELGKKATVESLEKEKESLLGQIESLNKAYQDISKHVYSSIATKEDLKEVRKDVSDLKDLIISKVVNKPSR